LAVDEKKLLKLDDTKALELFRSGELAWIYSHLLSLGSLSGMVKRIAELTGTTVKGAVKGAEKPAAKAKEKTPAKKTPAKKRSEKKAAAKETPEKKAAKKKAVKKK